MRVNPLDPRPETPAAALQREFLAAMRLLYPKGCASRQQHKDLIQTFALGWAAALLNHGGGELLVPLQHFVRVVGHPNWQPTTDWAWWLAPDGPKIINPTDLAGGPLTDAEILRALDALPEKGT